MTEAQHQMSFVKWFRYFFPHLTIFHIPNGEKREPKTAYKLKQMGVLKGIPDLYVIEYKLAIEMKNVKGRLSKDQINIRDIFLKNGHHYITPNGFQDAVSKTTAFLKTQGEPIV